MGQDCASAGLPRSQLLPGQLCVSGTKVQERYAACLGIDKAHHEELETEMSNVEAGILCSINIDNLSFETGSYYVAKAGWICHVAQG